MPHLFDGYALIQKLVFSSGQAMYRSRLVRSASITEAETTGRPKRAEFGQPLSLWERLRDVYCPIEMTGIVGDCGYVGHGLVNCKHNLSLNPHHSVCVDNTNVTIQRVSGQRE